MHSKPSILPAEQPAPTNMPRLVSTPPDGPNPLRRMWRESIGELPPSLSCAQHELLRKLTEDFAVTTANGLDTFAGMVIQQMDHLLARIDEQDKLLLDLSHKLARYEAVHVQEKHKPVEIVTPSRNSVQGVWADGVSRSMQPPGLE